MYKFMPHLTMYKFIPDQRQEFGSKVPLDGWTMDYKGKNKTRQRG